MCGSPALVCSLVGHPWKPLRVPRFRSHDHFFAHSWCALCPEHHLLLKISVKARCVVLDFNSDASRHLGLATDWHLWQMCHCGIFGANRCPMYAPTVCADCHASHTLCSRAACSQCRQASSRAGSGQRGRAHARARATFCSAHFWAWPSRLPSCVRGAEKVVKLV